jgi:hypothetical protein
VPETPLAKHCEKTLLTLQHRNRQVNCNNHNPQPNNPHLQQPGGQKPIASDLVLAIAGKSNWLFLRLLVDVFSHSSIRSLVHSAESERLE